MDGSHDFTDPITGAPCTVIVNPDGPWPGAAIRHPGCDQLADVTIDLDAFYCPTCRHNGRVNGAWVYDLTVKHRTTTEPHRCIAGSEHTIEDHAALSASRPVVASARVSGVDLDLAAIEADLAEVPPVLFTPRTIGDGPMRRLIGAVPALVAEVKRLRAVADAALDALDGDQS